MSALTVRTQLFDTHLGILHTPPIFTKHPQTIMARNRKYDDRPANMTEALHSLTKDHALQRLTLLDSARAKPSLKADVVEAVAAHLTGPKLQAAWEQLDEIDQAAVAEAAHDTSGKYNGELFKAKYGKAPRWSTPDEGRFRSGSKPALLTVFFHREHYGQRYIPSDLRLELMSFVPAPIKATLKVCESLPSHFTMEANGQPCDEQPFALEVREMEPTARHDLRAALGLVEAGKLSVSEKTRLPGAASCKALGAVLLGGDYYDDEALEAEGRHHWYQPIGTLRGFAWPLLLQAGGVAEISGKRLHLSKVGRKALTDAPEQTLRGLWQRWIKTTMLDEFRRIDNIKGQTGKGGRGMTALAGRRKAIESALQQCPVGVWVEVDQLFRYMRATGEDFHVTSEPWLLYVVDSSYGSLGYDGDQDWVTIHGRYALCVLFEYAATLGLIDVAYIPPHYARRDYADLWGADDLSFLSRYDGLQYLRLTALGAWCLGLTDEYIAVEPEQSQVLRVLPNLDIVGIEQDKGDAAGNGLDPGDLLLLDSFAKRRSDSVWQLDQTTLLAATEQGRSIEEFKQFLLARSMDALPDTVERLLSDTLERATLLQDKGAARLIECADKALAVLISRDSRCKKLCLLAGERHLVVYAASESRFRNEVRKLGYSLPES